MENNNLLQSCLINRYKIRQELSYKPGRKTFLAEDIQNQQLVIVKILQLNQDFRWEDLKLFEREAKTLQNLDHPTIPKYLDYFEVEIDNIHSFALVQTYIEAPSLEQVIQNGFKFSEAELMEFAERVLDILIYLHQQIPPVIHRDIKPSNILLYNRSGNSIGDIYLVDFGSVQTAASKEQGTITIVGSYGYMPLEQFGGQTTSASDLYSLGMTLVYLITGVHPAELTQINGQVKFDSNEVSRKFLRWLEKMTYPNLDRRFDSAKSALNALKSEDGSYGDYSHLKPAGSEIKLYRDRDKLEITTVRHFDLLNTPITAGGCWITILSFILLFCGPIGWIILFILLAYLIANQSPIYQILSINKNETITLKYCDNYSKRNHEIIKSSPYKRINFLTYSPDYTFNKYLDENGKKINRGTVQITPRLSIYAGPSEYQVGNDRSSPAELLWLGKELSDFLGLEMQTLYQTPRVPSQPDGCGC